MWTPLHLPSDALSAAAAAARSLAASRPSLTPPSLDPPPPQCYNGAKPTPSGAQSFDDVTTAILTQTLVEKILPAMLKDEDLADQVCGDEGIKRLAFSDVSGCFSASARNPRSGAVNGIAEWVCNGGARIRRVAIQTRVKYNKAM